MKKISLSAAALLLSTSTFANNNAYQEALETLKNAPTSIKSVMNQAPKVYEFPSQFDSTKSSVAYTGQTFRQVLINDIYVAMATTKVGSFSGSNEEAINWINSYYSYDEANRQGANIYGDSFFKIKAKNLNGNVTDIDEGFFYSDIQSPGKNLVKKTAGVDNPLRRGQLYGLATGAKTPQEQIDMWVKEFATSATSKNAVFTVPNGSLEPQTITFAKTTQDGRDLSQLVQKFLHGAVSYSQAARDYFSVDLGATKGLNADNSAPAKQGKAYTAMEHHFDEGFGYFGAARDYLSYTDLQIRKKLSIDSDNNDFISVKKEMNLGISYGAGRIDLTAVEQNMDLSHEAMTSFLKGRQLITAKPADYKKYVVANARVALGAWEKTIAGIVIHYINYTIAAIDSYGTNQYLFSNFAKWWSEMKGYALAFQFNPNAMMTDANFDKMHALMKDAPVLPHVNAEAAKKYKQDLLKARNILQTTYDFTDANVKGW